MASELETYKLHLFLLSDSIQINDNKYLQSLETTTEFILLAH